METHPDNHVLHTFLSCNLSYPSLSPVTSLITLTNDCPVLMDLLLDSQKNFKTMPDVGCSKIITATVNIIVYDSLFQCCNRHKQIPGYLSYINRSYIPIYPQLHVKVTSNHCMVISICGYFL